MCTLPVAHAVKSIAEGSHVVWVVDKRFAGIPKLCGSVDEVVEVSGNPSGWIGQVRGLGEFDLALDMQGLAKSALIVGAARAKRKLGYHWQREFSALASARVLPDATSLHVVDQYVDVARAAGAEVGRARFDLRADPQDTETMAGRLRSSGWDGSAPVVLCNAGAGWATKRWAPENFAFVSHKVAGQGGQVAFLGTESDRPAYQAVIEAGAETIDMLGKSNVRELVALVQLCAVHLAGDTGSTHIAAALGKPAVGVYTLTNPERCCPYGQIENSTSVDPSEVADRVLSLMTG